MPSLHITFSDRQLALLLNVMRDNLLTGGALPKQDSSAITTSLRASLRLVHLTIDLVTHVPDGNAWYLFLS